MTIFTWIEKILFDLLSVLVPFATPVMPAYLTYIHVRSELGFPDLIAKIASFVVEALGLVSVATAIRFWRYNLKYKKVENKAPFKWALGVYLTYILIVVLTNVVLEIVAPNPRSGLKIFAIALFSLLSFPSGVLYAIRIQFSDMLTEKAEGKAKGNKGNSEKKQKFASDYKSEMLKLLEDHFIKTGKVLAPREISAHFKLNHNNSKGFISKLTSDWKRDRPMGYTHKESEG